MGKSFKNFAQNILAWKKESFLKSWWKHWIIVVCRLKRWCEIFMFTALTQNCMANIPSLALASVLEFIEIKKRAAQHEKKKLSLHVNIILCIFSFRIQYTQFSFPLCEFWEYQLRTKRREKFVKGGKYFFFCICSLHDAILQVVNVNDSKFLFRKM